MATDQNPESLPRKTFEELARQLECDEDEEAFKAKLRQIAKTPPQHRENAKDSSE